MTTLMTLLSVAGSLFTKAWLFPECICKQSSRYLEEFSTQQQVSASSQPRRLSYTRLFHGPRLEHFTERRWNNSKNNLKPTFINDGLLTYNFMGSESFDGGTEFHTFDTKRLNQVGLGVKTSRLDTCWEVYLYEKKNRSIAVYSFQNDINGRRFFNRADVGNPDLAGRLLLGRFLL